MEEHKCNLKKKVLSITSFVYLTMYFQNLSYQIIEWQYRYDFEMGRVWKRKIRT